ncbi:transcriptional regulator [Nocardia callitridis]|uniref:transcriptional regulator n=1 Tax=Nocardia callitridis TaxID=648753 RepID=UPI003CD069DC
MSAPPRRSEHNRPALIALVIVATLGCLALAWWQWERFESANGTGQNLGYALQWPLFAGFAVFAYFRFVRLEREAGETGDVGEPEAHPSAPTGSDRRRAKRAAEAVAPRELPEGLLPQRPQATQDEDPALAEYNRYLAALHAADVDEHLDALIQPADARTAPTERSAG